MYLNAPALLLIMQLDMSDGTLAWLVAGSLVTFLLSRKKGRTVAVSLGWTVLSAGAGFFLGSVGTHAIERIAGEKVPHGAGEFFITAFGVSWIPPILAKVTKKAEGVGD